MPSRCTEPLNPAVGLAPTTVDITTHWITMVPGLEPWATTEIMKMTL